MINPRQSICLLPFKMFTFEIRRKLLVLIQLIIMKLFHDAFSSYFAFEHDHITS